MAKMVGLHQNGRHVLLLALLGISGPAHADAVSDFYRGKTIQMLVGVNPGGEYDVHARLLARHLGRHIPGNPTIIVQNMPGAGGLAMSNYLYNLAPKDGTTLGVVQNGSLSQQAVGIRNVQYDTGKFQWIGSISPMVQIFGVWQTTGITSLAETRSKEIAVGTTGRGNASYSFPMVLKELYGAKLKLVTGYPGGNDINVAMERGEIGGRVTTWSSWKVLHPAWFTDKLVRVLAYAGPRPKDLADVAALEDIVPTLEDRQVVRLLMSGAQLGRPLAAPPGVPIERMSAIRAAFHRAMTDPAFVKEAGASSIEIDPVSGDEMQRVVSEALGTPAALRERAFRLLE
jgi:tripartite-type tricarboxylate transporter receptor subunit TctC